jgi:hypothetical protein
MVALLPNPEPQFCDADGNPYAGGTIATYVSGTTTPKATWLDPNQTAFNTNPIILDAAGRCVMYGDGDYRLILNDAAGNLIWDQPSSTIVSAAMEPVMAAPTIAEAVRLLGIQDLIDNEAAARAAADSAEQAARIAADNAETARAEAAEANLQSELDAEIARAEAAEGALAVSHKFDAGSNTTDGTGHLRVTFATTFTSAPSVCITELRNSGDVVSPTVSSDTSGFDVWLAFPLSSGITPAGARGFCWMAIGS